jgi:hypothetical protein
LVRLTVVIAVGYPQIARSASLPSGSASVHQPGRVGVADDPAAGRERGVNPGLYLVVRQVDVDVESVAPGPGRLHLLEPERRPLAVRVQQDLFAAYGVAEKTSVIYANSPLRACADTSCTVLAYMPKTTSLQPGGGYVTFAKDQSGPNWCEINWRNVIGWTGCWRLDPGTGTTGVG